MSSVYEELLPFCKSYQFESEYAGHECCVKYGEIMHLTLS